MARKSNKPKNETLGLFDPKPEAPAPKLVPALTPPKGDERVREKLMVKGHEKLATRWLKRRAEMNALGKDQSADEVKLIGYAKEARVEAEMKPVEDGGGFRGTVAFEATEGQPVQVVYVDSYSDVGVEHEQSLKEALGPVHFDALIAREAKIKLLPNKTLTYDALKEVLGDRFEAFQTLFEVVEFLTPVEGFMETRAGLRPKLSEAFNGTIDKIVGQVQAKPSVKPVTKKGA